MINKTNNLLIKNIKHLIKILGVNIHIFMLINNKHIINKDKNKILNNITKSLIYLLSVLFLLIIKLNIYSAFTSLFNKVLVE